MLCCGTKPRKQNKENLIVLFKNSKHKETCESTVKILLPLCDDNEIIEIFYDSINSNHIIKLESLVNNYNSTNNNIQLIKVLDTVLDDSGNTLMHYMAYRGKISFLKYLKENGASIATINYNSESPYSIMKSKFDVDISI